MSTTNCFIFGVIGNMGPEADAKFQDLVRIATIEAGAKKDQEHIPMIVVKNPRIPDRSEAINEGGTSPVIEIVKSAKVFSRFFSVLIKGRFSNGVLSI